MTDLSAFGDEAVDDEKSWLHRALDPADSLCEVTCGLVMVLTVLLTAGYYVQGQDDPKRTLLAVAVGVNLAWGLIDGLLYVMSNVYERGRMGRLVTAVKHSPESDARRFLADQIQDGVHDLLPPAALSSAVDAAYARALAASPPARIDVDRTDFASAAASVVCNMAALVPASIPFLLIDDWQTALRVSNVFVVAMMFAVGFSWGRVTSFGSWRSGLALLGFGLGAVLIAVLLGG